MGKSIKYRMLAYVLAFTCLVSCGKSETETTSGPSKAEIASSNSEANLVSGVFKGEGKGHNGAVVVEIDLKDNVLSDIKVIEHQETEGLSGAMDTLREIMVNENTVEVDTVSGATASSNGFIAAVKDALKNAGLEASDLVKKDVKVTAEDREDSYEADVIVIGAGGAGMTAALTSLENGASAIIIEKMPMVGGNTLLSGGEMAAPGNWIQVAEEIEDSPDALYEDALKGGDNKNDPALVRVLADNALERATWLRDEVNVTFEDYQMFFGGHSVKRSLVPLGASGQEIAKKLKAKVDEKEIPVHLNTKAVTLLQDESGKVVGVEAEYKGKTITYNAKKGVILSTGGFGSNIEMRVKYDPFMDEKILSTNSPGSMGDGIVMAEAIGADVNGLEYIQTYPICNKVTGELLYVDDVRLLGRSILVNKEGKRFVEELGRRDTISKLVVEQTGGVSYTFWDGPSMVISEVKAHHTAEYLDLIENKMLVEADTIEEAADFFGIDKDALLETVKNYNEYAENGEDKEFQKRGKLVPFTEGPYYIMVSVPAVHHTMGGIKINDKAEVVNKDGNVIPGLYAAGEVTGGVHGANRLGSNAIADIIVFGTVAGENAAKN